jgi:hypothetical protein
MRMTDGYTTAPSLGCFSEETRIRLAAEAVRTAFEEIAELENYGEDLNGLCGRAAVQFLLEAGRLGIGGVVLVKGSGHGFCRLADGRIVDTTATQFYKLDGAPADGYGPVEIGRKHDRLPSWYVEERHWDSFDAWRADMNASFFGASMSWKKDREQVRLAWKRLKGKILAAKRAELIAAVRKHAMDHYKEGGWDFVVECYEDSDIAEEMGDARTPAEAIAAVGRIAGIRDERRRDALAEIF